MRNYDRVHPRKPEGIENRKAYIVGGGIAGMSAAAFLVRDVQMPGENIIIYDQLPVFGGSMDATGNAETGYISRGERELEPYMECLWDLFGSIPSIYEEGRTVLDETRESNKNLPINSKHRLWFKGFDPSDERSLGLTPKLKEQMMKMMTTPEDDLENITIEEWVDPEFFETNLWYYWSAMLAFRPSHSLIEMRRYAVRFIHQLHWIKNLNGILRTKYDQYNSMIRPLQVFLQNHGAQFVPNTTVTDMELEVTSKDKVVRALELNQNGQVSFQEVFDKDLVFFTNGSMTQNSTRGSMTEAAVRNESASQRGCFTLWEKLAKKADNFGRPEKFISSLDETTFVSATFTIKDYPQLFRYFEEKTGNQTGAGGVTTFVDSPWQMTYNIAVQPVDPEQPDNVQTFFLYGLYADKPGTVVKKTMKECTGEEILQEFLYYCGLEDKYDEIRQHTIVIPTIMPYIMSQFMPRALEDRPMIIPEGSKNLAFIGQFVELPGDCVFTVETSVRTAMTAVYRMLHLDAPVPPLFEGKYDIRMVKAAFKLLNDKETEEFTVQDLPKVNPLKLKEEMVKLVAVANEIPEVPGYYQEIWENQ